MSVARTARRRRKQAAMGVRGQEQVFGKRACPHYPSKMSRESSERRETRLRENMKRMQARGKK